MQLKCVLFGCYLSEDFSIICKKISTTFHNFRQVIYMTKSIGPKTLPWGIPLKTVAGSDFITLKLTNWRRLFKKALIHCKTLPLIPCDLSLPSSLSWGTLSNALSKSKYIVSKTPQILQYRCTYQDNCVVVDLPYVKPDCSDDKRFLALMWGSLSNL